MIKKIMMTVAAAVLAISMVACGHSTSNAPASSAVSSVVSEVAGSESAVSSVVSEVEEVESEVTSEVSEEEDEASSVESVSSVA